MGLVVKNVRFLNPNGKLSDNKNIFVEDDGITKIDNASDGTNLNRESQILDCKGDFAVPGFMNCHTHLFQCFGRGLMDDIELTKWLEIIWKFPELFSEEAIYYSTLIGAIETLKSGSISVADIIIPGIPENAVADAITSTGLRLVYGKMANDYMEGTNTPAKSTEKSLQEAEDFYHKWHGKADGKITTKFTFMGLPAATKELVMGIGELSRKYGVGIHAHAAEGKAPTEKVRERFGMGEIQALESFGVLGETTQLAHVIWIDDEEIEILKNTGTTVIHCPLTNCKLTDGLSPMHKFQKTGINIAFGTDGAASSSNHDLLLEARTGAMLQKVASMDSKSFDAPSVFKMLCKGAGDSGFKNPGEINEGDPADFLILDSSDSRFLVEESCLNNLIYGSTGKEIVKHIIIAGEAVVKNRETTLISEKETILKAKEVLEKEKHKFFDR
jgi:5-methylthioadenosine/S-adenosylhomocysteine deaminase